jgi:hypothetical protein
MLNFWRKKKDKRSDMITEIYLVIGRLYRSKDKEERRKLWYRGDAAIKELAKLSRITISDPMQLTPEQLDEKEHE